MNQGLTDYTLYYEEMPDKKLKRTIFTKKGKDMSNKVESNRPKEKKVKTKTILSVYTYLNFKRFGLSVAIDDGIKINVLWLETNVKFEKIIK